MFDVKLIDLILHIPNFLNHAICNELINEFELRSSEGILENCADAITGIDTYSSYERIILKKEDKLHKIIHSATEDVINLYLEHLERFNGFHVGISDAFRYSHMHRLLKYPAGAKIHPHIDHDTFIYGSCSFNLNDEYEGGDFSFFRDQHRVKLGKGDVIIWPADFFWVHEVKEVTKGTRYSTNCFLQRVPESVRLDVNNYVSVLTQREHEPHYELRKAR
jgi:hypothetical protein